MAEKAAKLDQSPAALKRAVDASIIEVLEIIGFHRNSWKFEPQQVRWLLRGLTAFMTVLSLWSFSHNGRQRYTFAVFAAILGALHWLWFRVVEFGGGVFLFSPDWRDSYVKSKTTATNLVLTVRVGYAVDLLVSLPLIQVGEHISEQGVDEEWLANEIHQQLNYQWQVNQQ